MQCLDGPKVLFSRCTFARIGRYCATEALAAALLTRSLRRRGASLRVVYDSRSGFEHRLGLGHGADSVTIPVMVALWQRHGKPLAAPAMISGGIRSQG